MKTIKAEITGTNDLLAQFVLQDAISGEKQVVQNSKMAGTFRATDQQLILMGIFGLLVVMMM